jgi:type IV pilus assembly protein PilX
MIKVADDFMGKKMTSNKLNIAKRAYRRQQGVILIVSLIMLLALTAIGVTLSSGSLLQERMAGNNRQASLARLNAESALREAESRLDGLFAAAGNVLPIIEAQFNTVGDELRVAVNSSGLVFDDLPAAFDVTDPSDWTGTAAFSQVATAASKISSGGRDQTAPRYMVEYIGLMPLNQPPADIDMSAEAAEDIPQVPHAFRITAIGYGQNNRIYSVLQSIYSTVK